MNNKVVAQLMQAWISTLLIASSVALTVTTVIHATPLGWPHRLAMTLFVLSSWCGCAHISQCSHIVAGRLAYEDSYIFPTLQALLFVAAAATFILLAPWP